MARDDDVEKWRRKYKHDLKDMVEQKTAAAEKRVTQAEDQLKKIKKQAKEDVVAIRAELISAATEAVTAKNPHSNQSPQQLFTEAEIVLKRLRNQSPKRYSELMKDQPDFGLLAARSMATGHAMQQRSIGEDVNSRDVSVSMPGNAVAVTKEALRTLEMDLMSASEDMRTNSTLANQKKTLVSHSPSTCNASSIPSNPTNRLLPFSHTVQENDQSPQRSRANLPRTRRARPNKSRGEV